jgi:DNA-binding transcriptional regulator YdaS (Cro superfamily)
MSRMIKSRWKSKFARFVLGYAQGLRDTRNHAVGGPTLLAQDLGIHPSSIYQWIRGASTPRPWHAERIRHLARARGIRLTIDQIYRHSRAFRSGRRLEAKSDVFETCESPASTAAKILQFPAAPNRSGRGLRAC